MYPALTEHYVKHNPVKYVPIYSPIFMAQLAFNALKY